MLMVFWFSTLVLGSQPTEFRLTHTDLGITGNVEDFEVDALGYLWIATTNGLHRYNGIDLESFYHQPKDNQSLGQNFISDLLLGPNGNMWVSTFGTGLARYDPVQDQFLRIPLDHLANTNAQACRKMVTCGDTILYAASYFGLNKLDLRTLKTEHLIYQNGAVAPNFLLDMIKISDQHLLLFPKEYPPYLFNMPTRSFESIVPGSYLHEFIDNLTDRHHWNSEETSLVVTCKSVLDIQNNRSTSRFNLPKSDMHMESCINDVATWSDTNLWLIIDNQLFYVDNNRLNPLDEVINLSGLIPKDPYILYRDPYNTLWIGCENGIFHVQQNPSPFRSIQISGAPNQEVYGLGLYGDSELLVSGWGGLYTYSLDKDQFAPLLMPAGISSAIRTVYAQHFYINDENQLIVPQRGYGILTFNWLDQIERWQLDQSIDANNSPLSSNDVMYLEEDPHGGIWIANFRTGIDILTSSEDWYHFENDLEDSLSLSSNAVGKVIQDLKGRMWISTYGGGLNLYIPGKDDYYKGSFQRINSANSALSHDVIPYVHIDNNNILWIGTYSGGLNRFDPEQNTFEVFTMEDGLSSNLIYSITPDQNGNLWLATDQGLVEFNPVDDQIRLFDEKDGLLTKELSYYANVLLEDGRLVLGTQKGMLLFHPDSIRETTSPVLVINSSFYINNKLISPGPSGILPQALAHTQSIDLHYQQRNIGFNYQVIETTNAANYQFAYQLEGFDEDWVTAGTQRTKYYTNLDPGAYIWKVKAGRTSGDWNYYTRPLSVVIAPPWYQQLWFRIILVLSIAAAIYMIYHYQKSKWALQFKFALQEERLQTLKKEEEASRLKTMLETTERERQRIAKDLHDTMGSILSRINSNVQILAKRLNGQESELTETTGEMISMAGQEIRRVAHDMMPSALERSGLCAALKDLMVPLRRKKLEAAAECLDIPEAIDDQLSLSVYRLIQELLHNVVKHAQASSVWVQLSTIDGQIQIIVEDDGVGFDAHAVLGKKNGLGLTAVQDRVDFWKGQLDILSKPGEGCTFTIHLPLIITNSNL